MEDNKNNQTKMKEIPALTVLKNNSILKNIVLLHKSTNQEDSDEQILLVGRHPNCNITLEHPSISRYHLRIHSNPSSHSLSVFDLSSVHGTWVSGKRIEPGVHVKLKEGDAVKMGGSSRIYELHWVPASRAYDDDGRFVSSIYTIKEGEEDMNQDEKLELHLLDDDLACSELSFSDMIHHHSPVKKLNLLTSPNPDCLTSSSDDTGVECSSPSETGNGAIFGIEDSDGLNTSENQSNWSIDDMSNEFKMLSHETHKDGPLSVPNCSKSSFDDTALFQPTLVVSETISAIEDSVSLNFSEDELNWLMDNLINEFELQNDEIIAEDPFSVLNCSLFESEDELDWLRDNLSNEFDLENHGIINEDTFSVPNSSKSFCDVTEVEHLSPWNRHNESIETFTTVSVGFSETISAIEDSVSLNKSTDGLNFLKDNSSNEFELLNHRTIIHDVFSVPSCSKPSCHDSKVQHSSPLKTQNENGQIFATISSQSPLVSEAKSETEISDSLNKPDDQMNWLNGGLNIEFELQNHEIIKEEPISVPICSKSSCDNTEVEYSSPWETEISDDLNKSEVQLNWLTDNLSNGSQPLSYGTMKDGHVSVACFDATKSHEKDACNQDIERHNEIVMGNENEPENQQTVNNVSVTAVLSNDVNRDEDGSFMPDTAKRKEANVDSDYEQMNYIKLVDESAATVVLTDGAELGNKLELIDHVIKKKESVFMPDGTDVDQEQSFTPDISRAKEVRANLEVMKNVSVSVNGNELEIFTPDKENKNPNACSVKSLKKGWMEDVSSPMVNKEKEYISFSKELLTSVDESYSAFPQRSLNDVEKVDPFVYCEEALFFSSEKETKSRRLQMEGSYYSISYPQTVQKVINSSHNILGGGKKRWTMVVDTSSLLHVESLKHLKLLEGLKGTQIVIPKIVIRELMDIQSQEDLLKRSTEKVTLALKWIDECMLNTRWWILMDDEILVSSELESQVLETALNLRKEITDQKIIILSNDPTLKITAMAEGVMSEAAEEFHRSLVNPFSERFMWVGSLARGLTWTCINDDILRQKYHGCCLNGSQGLKGLKLLARDATFC